MSEQQDLRPTLQQIFQYYAQRRYAECERAARLALQSHPDEGLLWKALGVAYAAQGKTAPALKAKERAAQLLPRDAEAWGNLANSYAELGRLREVALCRERICGMLPESAEAANDWGNALREAQLMPEARVAYERALALRPEFPEALSNLANTLADLGRPVEAERRYREAIALKPDIGAIHSNLGNLLKLQGRHADALACYDEARRLAPDFAGGHSNYILALNHVPGITPGRLLEEARAFGRWASERVDRTLVTPDSIRGRGRLQAPAMPVQDNFVGPLRVGLVSGDLRNHPVGYFLESVLQHWPRERVELFAYPTLRLEDDLTQRIRQNFAAWHPVAHLDDAKAAALVAGDRIDVLVDLAGHTAHNRLALFAWKPAPVQATWLGYFGTTGVEHIDWILADTASIAPGEEDRFTERVWRLPGTRLCFTPPAEAPEVAPLPADAKGCITFGSFQNLGKINDEVLALWSEILERIPGARLRVQNAQLSEEASRSEFRQRLAAQGIASARVSLHGKSSREAYLRAHAEVDIVLDTFPYPGGTTTCEALWMGVPTVTLAGDTMLARQGASLLAAAGHEEWIAADAEHYVRLAAELASDLPGLRGVRSRMREQVAATPLFDAARFAGELASAFIAMSRAV